MMQTMQTVVVSTAAAALQLVADAEFGRNAG
jgi:hypothetical protein